MLYDRELHEPLTETRWSEARVRDAIASMVADAASVCDTETLWPAHDWDGNGAALPMKNLDGDPRFPVLDSLEPA